MTLLSPCYIAEFHTDPLRDFPVPGEEVAILLLKLDQRPLEPGVSSVDLVEPRHVLALLEEYHVLLELQRHKPFH